MGENRHPAAPASRSALREHLPVRGYLPPPGASSWLRPARGVGAALVLPRAITEAMRAHLAEIARTVAEGAHAVLLLDRAGWHTTPDLDVPEYLTLIFLPSRAPELNPVENIWQYLRQNWLSNLVFDSYDAVVDAACEDWNKLTKQPKTITSIGLRNWAHDGQT